MSRIDPGDKSKGLSAEGSGRVHNYLKHGIIQSYTLECTYNTHRTADTNSNRSLNNSIHRGSSLIADDSTVGVASISSSITDLRAPPLNSSSSSPNRRQKPPQWSTTPSPEVYHTIGKSSLIALLDMHRANPQSKLPRTKYPTLEKVLYKVMMEVSILRLLCTYILYVICCI